MESYSTICFSDITLSVTDIEESHIRNIIIIPSWLNFCKLNNNHLSEEFELTANSQGAHIETHGKLI